MDLLFQNRFDTAGPYLILRQLPERVDDGKRVGLLERS